MNGCMGKYSAIAACVALIGAGLAAPACAQPTLKPPPVHPNAATEQAFAEAAKAAPFPTFAQIPPLPKDVRGMSAWKASVMTMKGEGAQLAEAAATEPWTLGDTEGWAARERTEAAPPPPITQASSPADTEAFAAAMRARATPPPRKR
ncbi:MAG TPA: hypothetical protein VGF50_06545 [Caulobacteraceae bacterium]